jgi:hypothetical protein
MAMKLIVPGWAMEFTERLRRIRLAFKELEVKLLAGFHFMMLILLFQIYIAELIQLQRLSEKGDLFSNLLEANEEEDLISGVKLDDSELIGFFRFLYTVDNLVLKRYT